jgi:hypothetical protein
MSNPLAMSDEDFAKQMPPGTDTEAPQTTQTQTSVTEEKPVVEAPVTETPAVETKEPEAPATEPEVQSTEAPTPVEGGTVEEPPKPTDPAVPETPKPTEKPATDQPKKEGTEETKPTGSAIDYEGFYKQIMTPFKANGKTIELKNPQEALQLMQMGANYTRKMQDIAPHRKVLMMLETNGLLDEGKLSYLIDLDKKNPDAIKKLVKDAGINPMDIDTEAEPAYREGNHRVTDEEVAFHNHLDNLKSTDVGKETIRIIVNDWDQASKDALWKTPHVMELINQQRESGLYDQVATEINRQRTLGRIGPEVPFLQAYEHVGKAMEAAGAFSNLVQTPAPQAAPVPVATRVAAPKPQVTNNDRAAAASQTKTVPKPATQIVNPLELSDEDFLKQMGQFTGRL